MGVSLSLRGADIPNDGYVDVSDIGVGDDANALLCHTNKIDCCRSSFGNWYYPNGTIVKSKSLNENGSDDKADIFAKNGGSTSVVRLYSDGSPTERGQFYCVVPNTAGDNQSTIYVNICKFAIRLTEILQ